MKNIITIIGALIVSNAYCQTVFDFETYNTDDATVEEIYDVNVLTQGVTYNMEVLGTYSIWAPSYYSGPCGTLEAAPIIPSTAGTMTGSVSSDMEYFFAYPTSSICAGAVLPDPTERIEITLDNGLTWYHPTTNDPYNSAHVYTYEVIGEGFPIGVRHISATNFDDYGILRFKLTSTLDVAKPTMESNPLTLFPNPNEGIFSIGDMDIATSGTLTVYDISGKLVFQNNEFKTQSTIDLSNSQNGIYIVKYETDESQFIGRVLIH